jgi:hypothetical protein
VKCFSHFELFGHLIMVIRNLLNFVFIVSNIYSIYYVLYFFYIFCDSIKLIWPKFDRSHEFLWILLLFFLYFVIFSSSDPNWRVTWEKKIFRNRPTRNKNCLWQPCLLMDRDKITNLYRVPSIYVSYKVSFHLGKQFQRRRFLEIDQ